METCERHLLQLDLSSCDKKHSSCWISPSAALPSPRPAPGLLRATQAKTSQDGLCLEEPRTVWHGQKQAPEHPRKLPDFLEKLQILPKRAKAGCSLGCPAALGGVSGRGLGEKLGWHQCAWRSMRGGKGCGAASREGSDGCSFRGCAGGRKGKHAVRTSNGYIFYYLCNYLFFK